MSPATRPLVTESGRLGMSGVIENSELRRLGASCTVVHDDVPQPGSSAHATRQIRMLAYHPQHVSHHA